MPFFLQCRSKQYIFIAVALRLGSPHSCRCGSSVDVRDTHGLVCKHALSRVLRHHVLNKCVSRAFSTAAIPVKKEPSGLAHKDGKRADGCTLIPWHGGKPLVWDGTVCTTVADSYLTAASHAAGCPMFYCCTSLLVHTFCDVSFQ